jgi:hypothetical protein
MAVVTAVRNNRLVERFFFFMFPLKRHLSLLTFRNVVKMLQCIVFQSETNKCFQRIMCMT